VKRKERDMKEISEGYMKKVSQSFIVSVVILFFLGLNSCATGKVLKTESAKTFDVTGTFTLILHGCGYHGDMTTVAILAREDARRPFEVFAPEFNYKIKRNVPAEEAMKEAERFINCSYSYPRSSLRKILDGEGNTLGYELRPLYSRLSASSDVLDISYITNGKVTVTIRLSQEAERQLTQ
jgi:hypothetical protein